MQRTIRIGGDAGLIRQFLQLQRLAGNEAYRFIAQQVLFFIPAKVAAQNGNSDIIFLQQAIIDDIVARIIRSEAAHGTVQRHYYQHLKGQETSTRSHYFAWTGALKKRGELDEIKNLVDFAVKLEQACLQTIEDGVITKDLAELSVVEKIIVNAESFLREVNKRMLTRL